MVILSLRLPDGLHENLVNAADDRRVSVTWLINKMLEEGLERLNPEIKVTT